MLLLGLLELLRLLELLARGALYVIEIWVTSNSSDITWTVVLQSDKSQTSTLLHSVNRGLTLVRLRRVAWSEHCL